MPPEEKKEQPHNPENNPGGAPEANGGSSPDALAVIKAELDEERKARAAIQAALADKDKRITELQASVSVVQQAGETAMAELTQVKEAHTKAVTKYLGMARAINPTIPGDVITGTTIDEIDASVAKARSIADSVKKVLEAQAKQARVPAGAPTRTEISLEGLSPREKIVAGIHQKGGTS
jgi:predicted transcriptional regulator